MRGQIKSILLMALLYCVLAPALFGIEFVVLGSEAYVQVFPICILSTFFFVVAVASCMVLRKVLHNSKHFEILYLATTMLLLLIGIAAFLFYAVLIGTGLLAFTVNLSVFYVATLISVAVFSVRCGRNKEKKQC